MNVGDRIIALRQSKNVSRKDLAEHLNIPYTTLRNYETNVREPGHKILIALADYFHVSVDNLLGHKEEKQAFHSAALTPPELEHIKKYRTLDGHGKEAVDSCLAVECRRMEEMRKAASVAKKPKAAVIDLRRYWESPSAGNGNDLTDGGYDIIQVPDTLTARLASYALTVSGDSMEPDLMDGDTVLVKAQETYEVGDIVVFAKNGESYIKYAGEDCFESANPDYPDIVIGEDDSVRCFGVVLGKL